MVRRGRRPSKLSEMNYGERVVRFRSDAPFALAPGAAAHGRRCAYESRKPKRARQERTVQIDRWNRLRRTPEAGQGPWEGLTLEGGIKADIRKGVPYGSFGFGPIVPGRELKACEHTETTRP